MPRVTIQQYRGTDISKVVDLLSVSLTADPVTPALFTRRVLLDPNFDLEGAPVARVGDAVVGFLLALARKRPLEDGADDSERGWITLFAVAPEFRRQGIGTALLNHAIDFLRARNRETVAISPYAPNYWAPGVDVAAYPEAITFLEKQGFKTVSRPISMDTRLVGGWRVPDWLWERESKLAQSGVKIELFDPTHIPALNQHLREEFP